MSRVVKLLSSLAAGMFIWSVLEPYQLVTERHEAEVPNLPAVWEGERVALLSDLHIGLPLWSDEIVDRAVERVLRARPRLVLVTGDFVHDTPSAIGRCLAALRPVLRARIPVYAVLGNHDYAMPSKESSGDRELARQLTCALDSAGIRVLKNEVVELKLGDEPEPLYLVGVGSHTAGEDCPAELLDQLPTGAPRVVMMHHPASFDACPPHTAPFAVGGHTHGGQVRLPLAPLWRYFTYIKEVKVFVSGWIDDRRIDGYGQEGNRLYISRGVGCSVAPLRLFCPPEVTLFTLRKPARKGGG